jgi:arginase family enzyme
VQARQLLEAFWQSDQLTVFEITELNPLIDRDGRTGQFVAELINRLLEK